MYNGALPDSYATAKEYAFYAKDLGLPGVSATSVYYFDIENAHLGSTQWGMIFQHGQSTNNTRYYLMPDSGSAP